MAPVLSNHADLRPRDDYKKGRNFGLATKLYMRVEMPGALDDSAESAATIVRIFPDPLSD